MEEQGKQLEDFLIRNNLLLVLRPATGRFLPDSPLTTRA